MGGDEATSMYGGLIYVGLFHINFPNACVHFFCVTTLIPSAPLLYSNRGSFYSLRSNGFHNRTSLCRYRRFEIFDEASSPHGA